MKTPEQNKQNQQTCNECGRVVGCDYTGRKHKCKCVDEKYQCGSCEQFFSEPKNGECPHCGSGNFVKGCIDD